jgi:hypothetical protein
VIFGRACRDFCMRTQRLTAADANWEARLPIDTLYLHIAKASLAGGEAHCEWEGGCRAQALVYCVDHNTALCAEHDKHVHAGLLHMHVRETCMAGRKQLGLVMLPAHRHANAQNAVVVHELPMEHFDLSTPAGSWWPGWKPCIIMYACHAPTNVPIAAAAQNTPHTCVWRHTQPTQTRFSRLHTCARPAACRTSHMKSVFGPGPRKPAVVSRAVPQTSCKWHISRSKASTRLTRMDSCAHREV